MSLVNQLRANGPPLPPFGLAAPAAGPTGISFEDLEVTQVIQNMPHVVDLVAEKTTIVRVYLGTLSQSPITVHGVIRVKSSAAPSTWFQVASIGNTVLNPAENGQLRVKRENLGKSLNFMLPTELTGIGSWTIKLFDVRQIAPSFSLLPVPAAAVRVVTFQSTPPLRVRIIGVRYTDSTHGPPTTYEPSTKDFTLIRSWLGRAYPVASVMWSQATVNGPNPWPFDASQNNAFIRALRAQDMAHGADQRTHYFGLVHDGGGQNFMRGLASGIPTNPDPSTVASGPTGSSTFGWDTDGSYGDWYTGHELGHTFGRYHAEFCGAVGGQPFPYPNGQISPDDGSFVGMDVGDPAAGLPMAALPGVVWHDLMSYCEYQWLSDFTYLGIRNRIVAEAALPTGPPATPAPSLAPGGGTKMNTLSSIHAVGVVNITKGTGKLQFVNPLALAVSGATPGAVPEKFTLRLKRADGTTIADYPAHFYPDDCTEQGHDRTGVIDTTIPLSSEPSSLELLHDGRLLDTFYSGPAPVSVQNIQPAAPVMGAASANVLSPHDPVITWDVASAAGVAAAIAPAASAGRSFSVQVSTDDGKTWSTVAIGLKQPQTSIDRSLFESASKVHVRVISTNGFASQTSTKVFSADQL